MISATDELRRLLDERGIEHFDGTETTLWGYEPTSESTGAYRFAADETSGGRMQVHMFNITPEQAIAATLSGGKMTAEQVREAVEKHWHDLSADYDMPEATALPEYSYDWQAIADELNTRAEQTCKPTEEDCCQYCGEDLVRCNVGIGELGGAVELDPPIYHNYCPNCGARVVE